MQEHRRKGTKQILISSFGYFFNTVALASSSEGVAAPITIKCSLRILLKVLHAPFVRLIHLALGSHLKVELKAIKIKIKEDNHEEVTVWGFEERFFAVKDKQMKDIFDG